MLLENSRFATECLRIKLTGPVTTFRDLVVHVPVRAVSTLADWMQVREANTTAAASKDRSDAGIKWRLENIRLLNVETKVQRSKVPQGRYILMYANKYAKIRTYQKLAFKNMSRAASFNRRGIRNKQPCFIGIDLAIRFLRI